MLPQLWLRLQLWLGCDPWPGNSICHRVAKKEKIEEKGDITTRELTVIQGS